ISFVLRAASVSISCGRGPRVTEPKTSAAKRQELPHVNDVKPPDDWQPECEELGFRRGEAERLGGEAAVAKHHDQGRKTIRERIAGLVDAQSFQEVGKLTGQGRYDGAAVQAVTPAPY